MIKKGANEQVTYDSLDPFGKILFTQVFGLSLENMKTISENGFPKTVPKIPPFQKILDKVLKASIDEQELDLRALED